jgi:O-antigen/teichoic acid export membrane protein
MLKKVSALLFESVHIKKYFFNTGWLFTEKIIRIIANGVVGVLMANYLGPVNYGLLNYALLSIAIFLPIAKLGLGDVITREFVFNPANENKLLGTGLILRFTASIIIIILIFFITYFSNTEPITKELTYIVSFMLIFDALDVFDRFFQSKVQAKTSVLSYIFSLVATSIFKVVLILVHAPLYWFAVVSVFELGILAIGWMVGYYSTINKKFTLEFSMDLAIKLLKDSLILILPSLMIVIYLRIDQVMIKNMLDNESLGNFMAAVKLSELFNYLPTVITTSLLPAVLMGKNMGEGEYKNRMQRLYDLLTWIAIPSAIIISLFSNQLAWFFGSKFHMVGPVLAIHIWSCIFVSWGLITSKGLVIEKMPRFVLFTTVTGSVTNIGLNLYMIPHFGILGAAFSTVMAQCMATFVSLFLFKRTRFFVGFILRSLNFVRVFSFVSTLKNKLK